MCKPGAPPFRAPHQPATDSPLYVAAYLFVNVDHWTLIKGKRQGKPSMQVDSGLLADGKPGGRCEVNELAMRAIGKTGEYGLQVFAHRDF